MRPLHLVVLGLLLAAVQLDTAGFDLLVDPAGWVLVLLGVTSLPPSVPRRPVLVVLAAVAGVASVPTAWPPVREAVADADASIGWALSLPQAAFTVALCHLLAVAAASAGHPVDARRLRLLRTVLALAALLPVVVLGAGVDVLTGPTALLAAVGLVWLVVLLLLMAERPWAQRAGDPASPTR